MSDLFLSTGIDVEDALLAREMRFTSHTRVQSGADAGVTWSVSRVDDFGLWGPAWDQESQTRVLIGGRIALEESDWAASERLPYEGGLAARHILSRWLNRNAQGVEEYNGAALIVVIDQRTREVHIWTDRMGFYPAFVTSTNGVIVASHPDVIARVCASVGRPLEIDGLTIAEYLHTGTVFHPHTLWRGVRHLDAARQYALSPHPGSPSLRSLKQYWKPAFLDGAPPLSRGDFVETFADAFRAAGRRRSWNRLGRTVVLLSSGADSRGVLAATRSPSEVDCYTYFDEPNEELEGARKIAALAQAKHFGLQRTPDYYVTNAKETVRLAGGMWGFDSGHHTGFIDAIREKTPGIGTVLTGEFCDLLFKGVGLNRRHLQILGRNLPLHRLDVFNHEYYLPFSPISPEWSAQVEARLEEAVPPALQRDADPRKVEIARLAPLSQFIACSSVLWRTLPLDVFVADNDILDAYGRMSVADKISGIAFGQAIARVTGPKIAAIPNNNFGSPVGTNEVGRVATFLIASARRKLKGFRRHSKPDDLTSVATTGSWPDLVKVALNSPLMREWYETIPERHGEALRTYLHPSRRDWSYEEFATRDHFQLYSLMAVALWLQQR